MRALSKVQHASLEEDECVGGGKGALWSAQACNLGERLSRVPSLFQDGLPQVRRRLRPLRRVRPSHRTRKVERGMLLLRCFRTAAATG